MINITMVTETTAAGKTANGKSGNVDTVENGEAEQIRINETPVDGKSPDQVD